MPKRKFSSFSKWPRRRGLTKRQKVQVKRIAYKSGEQKKVYSSDAGQAVDDTTGYTRWFLPNIAEGTGSNDRIGDTIHVDRLVVEGVITFPDSTNIVRIIVGAYRADAPMPASMSGWYPAVQTPTDSQKNNIVIWRDFLMTGGANGPVSKKLKMNIPLKRRGRPGMKVTYKGGLTDLENGGNNLFMFMISDSAAVSHPVWRGKWSLFYHDN